LKSKYISVSIIITIVLIISACTLKESEVIETQIMDKVPFPQSTIIWHTEKFNDGEIILYEDKSGFRAAFFSAKDDYFFGTGNAEVNPKDGFTWAMIHDPTAPFVLFSGVITDERIEEVVVKQITLEKKAKIIETNEGKTIWYATFDVLENADSGKPDPLKIEAYDSEGNIYWKDGYYEEGFFRGKTNK